VDGPKTGPTAAPGYFLMASAKRHAPRPITVVMGHTSDNPAPGEVRGESASEYGGEPISIGFNPKYVVELLGQMVCDQVTLSLGGELDPGLIKPLTGDDYLGVVMPMRI